MSISKVVNGQGESAWVIDMATKKYTLSSDYRYIFSKRDGQFSRWGKAIDDDPQFSPFGPEILDIEISTGDCHMVCPWCYKSNSVGNGRHMALETFKMIIDKLPVTLTQLALGITDADANPDFISIMRYAREKGIIPNYTTSGFGITTDILDATAELCGAVAVSVYPHNKGLAYKAIREFLSRGMKQVNVHLLYYKENLDFCYQVLDDYRDCLMPQAHAIVLLGLKPCGRAKNTLTPASSDEFGKLVDYCFATQIPVGFDSCSAPKFEKWVATADLPELDKKQYLKMCEPCESQCFSTYINVDGTVYPCSFTEGMETGISMTGVNNFIADVWESREALRWRKELLDNHRNCPVYDI